MSRIVYEQNFALQPGESHPPISTHHQVLTSLARKHLRLVLCPKLLNDRYYVCRLIPVVHCRINTTQMEEATHLLELAIGIA